jgi:hypothetical protein
MHNDYSKLAGVMLLLRFLRPIILSSAGRRRCCTSGCDSDARTNKAFD